MTYNERAYPRFSACGLNCGLCPRHHTNGTSRCPGCAGAGFSEKHPSCGVLSCCQRHGIEYCYLCAEYPCAKYDGADASDSFISHMNQMRDNARAKEVGMDAYAAELDRRVEILQALLAGYDDGRRKSFFCVATNLLPLVDLEETLARLDADAAAAEPVKVRAQAAVRLLQSAADARGIDLKLRR